MLPPGISNPEALLRMNFLSQATALLANTINHEQDSLELSRFYNKTLKDVSQKLVIRLDPKVKKESCKKCHTSLISSQPRIQRVGGEKHLVNVCLRCTKTTKKVLKRKKSVDTKKDQVKPNF